MADCQIALRFFASREKQYVSGSVKSMLDSCMKRNKSADQAKIDDLRTLFASRLKLVHDIFGISAFRLPSSQKSKHSRPLFDALMIACDRLWSSAKTLKEKKTLLRKHLGTLQANQKSYAVIVGRPNTAEAVLKRIALVEKAFETVL